MAQSLHSYLVEISAAAKAREDAAASIAAQPYVRGTKTVRVKTARLVPGDRVLTTASIRNPETRVRDAQAKTGAVVRVVDHLEAVFGRAVGNHRVQRTYIVHFTDGTRAEGNAPVLTWHALAVDKEGSASRQHFIDTGAYLTPAEVAEFAQPALTQDQQDLVDQAVRSI